MKLKETLEKLWDKILGPLSVVVSILFVIIFAYYAIITAWRVILLICIILAIGAIFTSAVKWAEQASQSRQTEL